MSHRALQRTLVRLLHDPSLVERFQSMGGEALEEPDLSEEELGWLVEADPRAFRTDPYRQGRVMTSLVEELPTSSALASGRLDGGLLSFFSSPLFHEHVGRDRPLRLGFADHLSQTGEDVETLVAIERSLMEARRARPRLNREIGIPGGVTWIPVPKGGLEFYEAIWSALATTGKPVVEAVLTLERAALPGARLDLDDERVLLIEPDDSGGFHVGEVPSGLAAVLEAARTHGTRRLCHQAALDSGAETSEASEIIDEMISEGLLVDGSNQRP